MSTSYCIYIYTNLSIEVLANKKLFEVEKKFIKTKYDLEEIMHTINTMLICDGTGCCEQKYSSDCCFIVKPHKTYNKIGRVRCEHCKKLQKKISRTRKIEQRKSEKRKEINKKVKKMKAENARLKAKTDKLKNHLDNTRTRLKDIKNKQIKDLIKENIASAHIEMVKAS
ncbi:GSCOCG00009144001-RA-CDS [Cotesia congregata]|nr:GSCOCG00009144001-RA-CDS [Cotesia congregata]